MGAMRVCAAATAHDAAALTHCNAAAVPTNDVADLMCPRMRASDLKPASVRCHLRRLLIGAITATMAALSAWLVNLCALLDAVIHTSRWLPFLLGVGMQLLVITLPPHLLRRWPRELARAPGGDARLMHSAPGPALPGALLVNLAGPPGATCATMAGVIDRAPPRG